MRIGSDQRYLDLPLDDDRVDENDGSVTIELLPGDGYTVDDNTAKNTAEVEITDNDDPPTVTITPVDGVIETPGADVIEGDNASWTLNLTDAPTGGRGTDVDIVLTQTGAYLASNTNHTLTLYSGNSTFSVFTHRYNVFKGDGSITATIQPREYGYKVGNPNAGTVTVLDNEEAPAVTTTTTTTTTPTTTTPTTTTPVTAPSAPRYLSGSSTSSSVSLSWSAPSSNGGASISGYKYRYKRSSYGSSSWTSWTSWSSTSVTIHGLLSGTSYDFEVRAYNSAGDGSVASRKVTTTTPVTAPSAPRYLSGSSTSSSVSLSWSAPSSNGGASISGYKYRYKRSSYGSSSWTGWTSWSSTSVTIHGLLSGTSYDFEVRAYNSAGNGSAASTTVTTTAVVLPVITVSRYSSSVTEGGYAYFRIHSDKAVPATLSVNISRSQNGAFASWSGSGTVYISQGYTQSIWFSVSTVNDSRDEAHGSLTMTVNSGTGYTVGSPSSATVTVYDNDVAALGNGQHRQSRHVVVVHGHSRRRR